MRPAFIVLCVLTLAAVGPAQADEQTPIRLSCDGTAKTGGTSKPITKLQVDINLRAGEVSFEDYFARIMGRYDWIISFRPEPDDLKNRGGSLSGDIDRVTGAASAMTETEGLGSRRNEITITNYDLVCKPVIRLF
jgi:hypothetical protein